MGEVSPRATPCEGWSDEILMERGADGTTRYLRADDPQRAEYTYAHPFILELELTRRCNLRCVHCYAHADTAPFADELELDELRRVLDQGREVGIEELSLTGGEVMLHEGFVQIIDDGLARGYGVRFVTNATLLSEQLLGALCRRPIKLITVSLDGISREAHERIRGPGGHEPALRALEQLHQAGFAVSVITAFSKLNFDEFDPLLEFCASRGINWQVQMTSAKGRCPREITLSPDQYYQLGVKVAEALRADLPIHVIPMDDLATYSHFEPLSDLGSSWKGRCVGGILNLFVRANGDVTPCSALAFDECVVGNVRRDSLAAICREERCREVISWARAERLTGVCGACPFKAECQGGCPEILLSMCRSRTENEYCYHRIEQQRIVAEALGNE
jgi:radical SAM protein with 4Fe4S-binding SPASM domain